MQSQCAARPYWKQLIYCREQRSVFGYSQAILVNKLSKLFTRSSVWQVPGQGTQYLISPCELRMPADLQAPGLRNN